MCCHLPQRTSNVYVLHHERQLVCLEVVQPARSTSVLRQELLVMLSSHLCDGGG